MERKASIERKTAETEIRIGLDLETADRIAVSTGIPFLDHMLTAFARHGYFGLSVSAKGDLEVDAHHTMEDTGLVLGEAVLACAGDKVGISRFGCAIVPMDDALVRVAVDISGRPWLGYRVQPQTVEVGGVNVRLFREFFQATVNSGRFTLQIDLLAGEEVHHIFEAVFKAFGRALGQALRLDPRCTGVPSTKGSLA